MKLLVLTPTRGNSPFLTETVDAVTRLTAPKEHVLICPVEARPVLTEKFPQHRIFIDEGRGIYAALNQGLSVDDDWEAFTWINDDDVLFADSVDRSWADMVRDDRTEVYYGRVDYIDATGRSLGPLPVCSHPQNLRSLFAAGIPALTQHGALVRRGLVRRLQGFDLRFSLAGDFDFWARAVAASAEFRFNPRKVGGYRLHRGQLSGDLEKVAAEIETSAREHLGTLDERTRKRRRFGFHLAHAPDVLQRFVRTGCCRSSTLYRRAAKVGPLTAC